MTQIHFTFNTQDRLRAACEIAARRYRRGERLDIYCSASESLATFDELLWQYSPTAFVPHLHAAHPSAQQTLILLHDDPEQLRAPWVLNLDGQCVPHAERFAHVVEVVSTSENERAAGRQRWREYKAAGHMIVQHDAAKLDLP